MSLDPREDTVPATIEAAVELLCSTLTPEERERIEKSSPDAMHHHVGMAMRNGWSFWEPETPLKRDAVETYGIAHADDLSGLILAWLWARVRQEPFDPKAHVQIYHEHWRRHGTTALQAGGYNEDGTPKGGRA